MRPAAGAPGAGKGGREGTGGTQSSPGRRAALSQTRDSQLIVLLLAAITPLSASAGLITVLKPHSERLNPT